MFSLKFFKIGYENEQHIIAIIIMRNLACPYIYTKLACPGQRLSPSFLNVWMQCTWVTLWPGGQIQLTSLFCGRDRFQKENTKENVLSMNVCLTNWKHDKRQAFQNDMIYLHTFSHPVLPLQPTAFILVAFQSQKRKLVLEDSLLLSDCLRTAKSCNSCGFQAPIYCCILHFIPQYVCVYESSDAIQTTPLTQLYMTNFL